MSKYTKTELIKRVEYRIDSIKNIIIWEPNKLKSTEFCRLRRNLYDKKIRCDFVKNSIAMIGFAKKGLTVNSDFFRGQTCLAYSSVLEANTLAAEMLEATKSFPEVSIKGGIIDSVCMSDNEIKLIASGPSKKEYVQTIGRLVLSHPQMLGSLVLSVGKTIASCVERKVAIAEQPQVN